MFGNNSNGELIYSFFFLGTKSFVVKIPIVCQQTENFFFFFFRENRLKMLYENININRINRGELMLEVIVKI